MLGFAAGQNDVLVRQFSSSMSILGLVFSYWLAKFSGTKVSPRGFCKC